jgi:hypothetical protein
MPYSFWVESEDLWVADDSRAVWRGRPDGAPVLSVVALPGTEYAVALLDAQAGPRNAAGDLMGWPNLVCVNATGAVIWRAATNDSQDCWVAVEWQDGHLYAHTWSCCSVTLDPGTGREISRVFTK